MMDRMAKHPGAAEWKALAKHVSLVIVDEGHCEPAVSWSRAIRSFQPQGLFSPPHRSATT